MTATEPNVQPTGSPDRETKSSQSSTTRLHTYHCLCTTHLLTTSHTLSSLPRRKPPTLDRAYFLPYSRPSKRVRHIYPQPFPEESSGSSQLYGKGSDDEADADAGDPRSRAERGAGTTVLHNTSADDAIIIRKEDGFEKRWLWRCARCDLVVGYWLGWPESSGEEDEGQDGAGEVKKKEGRRPDVLFVLPSALVSTPDMVAGKAGEAITAE
ncbi:MAG: hypothetical protein M1828_001230 [Chrysothrix sp. TS-e1954]|nr:MAG: hypothetical protein M1828_001230 [Chrysothrix sp. TS-e1954]